MQGISALVPSYRYYWKTACVALVIMVICLIPMPYVPVLDFNLADKWEHLSVYVVLTMTLLYELTQNGVKNSYKWLWGLILPIVYGGLIELLQGLPFIHRSMSLYDWLADMIGVMTAGLVYAAIEKIRPQ